MAVNELVGVEWWWVCGHWDHHLNGLVKYKGEVLVANLIGTSWDGIDWNEYYDDDGNQVKDEPDFVVTYGIYRLPQKVMRHLIQRKEMFELFVGTHWTYENGERGRNFNPKRKPLWLWYYKAKKLLKRVGMIKELHFREIVELPEAELVGYWKG